MADSFPKGFPASFNQQLYLQGHIGHLKSVHLEAVDGPAKLLTLIAICPGKLKGTLCQAEAHGPYRQAAIIQRAEHDLRSLSDLTKKMFFGYTAIVKV